MLTLLFAAALALPVPASPPIPVSTPVLGAAPFNQSGVRVATDGSITLAAWNDQRNGRNDVTAVRLTPDGTPLDSTGIVVRTGAVLHDLYWNGTSFVLLTGPSSFAIEATFAISTVISDGTVTQGDVLASPYAIFGARLDEGANTRFLFLPNDGLPAYARVVDVHGNTVRGGDNHYSESSSFFAAGNGAGFLELRGSTAYMLDRDGNVLHSKELQLPTAFRGVALAGDGSGGYVLFGVLTNDFELVFVRLDAQGVATGFPQLVHNGGPDDWQPGFRPLTVTADGGGFVASWADSDSRVYVSTNGGFPAMALECPGMAVDAAYEPVNDLLFASYNDLSTASGVDVFVKKGNGNPIPITQAARRQTNAAIATGAGGFLVAWTENSDEGETLYVRRYAPDATPLEEPRAADTASVPGDGNPQFGMISIVSSGDVYLVAWTSNSSPYARRMNARSGQWIDGKPFAIPTVVMASNGNDALALVSAVSSFPFPPSNTTVRRVSMRGGAVISDPVTLSDFPPASRPAIASNGTDYLAVWEECLSNCTFGHPTGRIVAARLRADGTKIDSVPITLASWAGYYAQIAVAWNGKTYLVSWANDAGMVHSAYVSAEGGLQPLGDVLPPHAGVKSIKIVVHAGEFLILTYELTSNSFWQPDELAITLLDGSTTTITTRPSGAFGPPDAASDGAHLMLVYDRVEEAAGRVGRVFIEPRVFPSRKRAVR